jgi:alpha-glucan,water dikinase
VTIEFNSPWPRGVLTFVLHLPRENRWLRNAQKDFAIELPPPPNPGPQPDELLARQFPAGTRSQFPLDGGDQLSVAVERSDEFVRVALASDAPGPLLLHWGVVWTFPHEWALPPEAMRPAGTTVFHGQAARTPFHEREGLRWLEMDFRPPAGGPIPRGLKFVVYNPETDTWIKTGGREVFLPLGDQPADPRLPTLRLWQLAEQIVGAEMGSRSWTLMHRYHRCHDLLDQAQGDEQALALLFTWLRYSAIRQLDWQRNYNTKPRELAAAQDRLTARVAAVWRQQAAGSMGRWWTRLMLTTLGRGGEGQQVRDEILHIMHRNGLKEARGYFVEEWHQKLHNNTTPDDVVICQAYLDFLRSDGDRWRFYQVLAEGGVSRQRLQSFERPIRTDPEFYPDRKDALIRDFENFLRILKSVHAGTDLEVAADAARGRLDESLRRRLDGLLALRPRGPAATELVAAAVALRGALAHRLEGCTDPAALRDLLYLDLALEEVVRTAVEQQDVAQLPSDAALELAGAALENVALSTGAEEVRICARHWTVLLARPRLGRDWALHARSVTERAARWLQLLSDLLLQELQPRAEFLGEAFKVESWVIPRFSEEVVRGGPAFALAKVLRHLDPLLRRAAGLGGWQVISPATAWGQVRAVDCLVSVQAERFAQPTVLLADEVGGEEEVPEGVTGVLTPSSADLVSHLAVRARNAGVLLATCYDRSTYDQLKTMQNRSLALHVTPAGDVHFEEKDGARADASRPLATQLRSALIVPRVRLDQTRWVLTADQFAPDVVGGKSWHLVELRGRLPGWIRLPESLALPFGVWERVLADDANRDIRQQCEALLASIGERPAVPLARLREVLLGLHPPAGFPEAVVAAWDRTGLSPVPWPHAWKGMVRVWASKWNERAYLSRRARGIPHDSLFMAVLIQQVVPADYAFVIHTVNPLTRSREELYAEVVLGLGETLVGNYPGRALGFVARKADLSLDILSYPGKSIGLFGRGVIFRSDSNGEDLEGFAGAGLYDSFLAEPAERRTLDYTSEMLVWDRDFCRDLLRGIARVGLEVETALGEPQDIEGAVAGGQFYVVQTRPQVGLT